MATSRDQATRPRMWAILTAIAGVVALGVTLAFQVLPEVAAAGTCMAPDAVVMFEFARTAADLDAIFGAAGEPCRPLVIAAMDAVNRLDVALYIPSYSAFVALAAVYLSGGRATPLVWLAAGLALGALAADYVETLSLLAYTPDLSPAPEALARSSTAAWLKFGALGLNALSLAGLCLSAAPTRRWILGALLCLPILGVAVTAMKVAPNLALTLGFAAAWTPLLALAIRSAITGRA
jgi:hypothetical protein